MGYFRPPSTRFRSFSMSVSLGLRIRPRTRANSTGIFRHMEIRIGDAILASMGWEPRVRLEVLWGHGPDFGKMVLQKKSDGVVLRARAKSVRSLVMTTAALPVSDIADEHGGIWRLREVPQKSVHVRHFMEPNNRLGIEIPNHWFEVVKEPRRFHLAG
jgi:hypothetical protein